MFQYAWPFGRHQTLKGHPFDEVQKYVISTILIGFQIGYFYYFY